jgi:hypothetical protein
MALSADRYTESVGDGHGPLYIDVPQGVNTLYEGGMVSRLLTGGYACPAGTALSGPACGVARVQSINAGSAGDVSVQLSCGQFWFANSADGDAITEADRFKVCYVVDDQTVALTSAGTRQPAGVIIDVDSTLGVKVLISPEVGQNLPGSASVPRIQAGRATFAAGVLAVAAGITVSATSRVFASRVTEAGTDGDEIRVPDADRTVGGPGTGSLTFRAFLSGAAATSDTSTFDYLIVG